MRTLVANIHSAKKNLRSAAFSDREIRAVETLKKASSTMSNLSVRQMLDLTAPGEERVFPADAEPPPAPPRFLEVTRNFERDSSSRRTDLKWTNHVPGTFVPSTGGVEGRRVSLFDVPQMEFSFIGDVVNALDYYDFSGEMFLVSQKLKDLIEQADPESLEFREAIVDAPNGLNSKFYVSMARRLLWAVDTRFTEVKIHNEEFLPGRFMKQVYYGDSIFIRDDIKDDIKIFSDIASIYSFWSRDFVISLSDFGITGLRAVNPSFRAGADAIYL